MQYYNYLTLLQVIMTQTGHKKLQKKKLICLYWSLKCLLWKEMMPELQIHDGFQRTGHAKIHLHASTWAYDRVNPANEQLSHMSVVLKSEDVKEES